MRPVRLRLRDFAKKYIDLVAQLRGLLQENLQLKVLKGRELVAVALKGLLDVGDERADEGCLRLQSSNLLWSVFHCLDGVVDFVSSMESEAKDTDNVGHI